MLIMFARENRGSDTSPEVLGIGGGSIVCSDEIVANNVSHGLLVNLIIELKVRQTNSTMIEPLQCLEQRVLGQEGRWLRLLHQRQS